MDFLGEQSISGGSTEKKIQFPWRPDWVKSKIADGI